MSEVDKEAPDPSSISMDDLAKLVNSTEPTISDEPVIESPDEPEEEPTEEVEAPTEAPSEEEVQEKAPEVEEAKPEDSVPDHVRLRLEATELERKKFEMLAGRHAGELGFLKNKLRELEARLQSQQESEPERQSYDATDQQPVRTKAQDRFAEWAVQQSLAQTVNAFTAQYPDSNDMAADIAAYWKDNGIDMDSFAQSNDPISAAQDTRTALELAYLHVATAKKHEAATKAEQEASRRTADEVKTLSSRRKAIAATPTGGVRAAVPTRNIDPRTMPLKDMPAYIERLGSGEE